MKKIWFLFLVLIYMNFGKISGWNLFTPFLFAAAAFANAKIQVEDQWNYEHDILSKDRFGRTYANPLWFLEEAYWLAGGPTSGALHDKYWEVHPNG